MAAHTMIESVAEKDRKKLRDELTGPLRAQGVAVRAEDVDAPSWWHGDEEAYASSVAAMAMLPRRRRRR